MLFSLPPVSLLLCRYDKNLMDIGKDHNHLTASLSSLACLPELDPVWSCLCGSYQQASGGCKALWQREEEEKKEEGLW